MTLVLNCGDALDVDDPRFDELGRFKLILQSDGNLVIYAHVLNPTPQIIATGHTHTAGMGSDVQLHLTQAGQLAIRQKSDPARIRWAMPRKMGFHGTGGSDLWYPFGREPQPGSSLHLQADGNLVLYSPTMKPEHVLWSMGMLLQDLDPEGAPDAAKVVASNALILSIPSAVLSPSGSTVVRNDSDRLLEVVAAMQRPVQVPVGGYATFHHPNVAQPVGTLSLPAFVAGQGDAIPAVSVPLPIGSLVSVQPMPGGGYGLVGV